MIAFSRAYSLKVNDKQVEHFDTYTNERIIFRQKSEGGDWLIEQFANVMQKIPVIYYSQSEPE
jgi:hypothetical protein